MNKDSPRFLENLSRLEKTCHYEFQDKQLAFVALTHSSFGEGRKKYGSNERMEFLGDRVLGLLTAELLYHQDPSNEGSMARHLNALVRKEACAKVARNINLGDALMMSPSEIRQGGRNKTSILGDACEAWLAAIYLDGGLEAAKAFYDRFWEDQIQAVAKTTAKDPKTELQEQASAQNFGVPVYEVVNRSGPDHRPMFVVEVQVDGMGSAQGTGKSKKDAERYAAQHLLQQLSGKT